MIAYLADKRVENAQSKVTQVAISNTYTTKKHSIIIRTKTSTADILLHYIPEW